MTTAAAPSVAGDFAIVLARRWPRLAVFEAACDAARFRQDADPVVADRIRVLADEVIGARCGVQARAVLRGAPAHLIAEIAGAVTDPGLIAAITGGDGDDGRG